VRPWRRAGSDEIAGYRHHLVMLSVVGTGLSLPIDVEPYGPGTAKYAAGLSPVQARRKPDRGLLVDQLIAEASQHTLTVPHGQESLGDRKSQHQLEHICHHHDNSILILWLLNAWP